MHEMMRRDASSAGTTVVVVPRETSSLTLRVLRGIIDTVAADVPIVVVDTYPDTVRRELDELARERPLTIIRVDRLLTPNQSRNLGWRAVTTEFLVIIDNDVMVEPGWLDHLEQCAIDTGAWAVGPVCLHRGRMHAAGGNNRIESRPDGRRVHIGRATYDRAPLETAATLTRQQTEMFEFHCALLRRDVIEAVGPLDEQIYSVHEYLDLCLLIAQAGGTIWLEPQAVVTYVSPAQLTAVERPYWFHRWSDRWTDATIRHFAAKWDVDPAEGSLPPLAPFGRVHRRYGVPWVRKLPAGMAFTARAERAVFGCWARVFETVAYVRGRHRFDGPIEPQVIEPRRAEVATPA